MFLNNSLWAFGCGLLLCAVASTAPAQPAQQTPETLPIRYLAHLTTIQVTVNGTGPHTFVVDTGAGVTVLNQDLASRLKLPVLGKSKAGSPMGTAPIEVDSLAVESFGIGDVLIENPPAIAMDLDDIFGSLGAPAGILAAASLDGYLMSIDFPSGFVSVRPGELPVADGQRVLEYESDSVVPHVPVSLGGETISVALDTGAPTSISVASRYADILPLHSKPTVSGSGRSVDAQFEVRTATLDGTLQIGAIEIPEPIVQFSDGKFGHIGMRILGELSVIIDSKNHRIALERPEAKTHAPGPMKRVVRGNGSSRGYGIRLGGLGGDVLEILGVDAGLPAAQGGVMRGDAIVALNGQQVEGLSVEQRVAALRGSPLVLVVRRDGNEIELRLSLD